MSKSTALLSLFALNLLNVDPAHAGGHRIFCSTSSEPDLRFCLDKNGVFLVTDLGSEALVRTELNGRSVFALAERGIFVEGSISSPSVFLIKTDGVRVELDCPTRDLDRCP